MRLVPSQILNFPKVLLQVLDILHAPRLQQVVHGIMTALEYFKVQNWLQHPLLRVDTCRHTTFAIVCHFHHGEDSNDQEKD